MAEKTYKSSNVVPKKPKPAPRPSKKIDGRKNHNGGTGGQSGHGR